MDFALPRAQHTFVSLKKTINLPLCKVWGWSLQRWLGCSSQGRAGLGHPSTSRNAHQHSFPCSAPAWPQYCCSSSLQGQRAARPQPPAQPLSWHHASLPDQRMEDVGCIPPARTAFHQPSPDVLPTPFRRILKTRVKKATAVRMLRKWPVQYCPRVLAMR